MFSTPLMLRADSVPRMWVLNQPLIWTDLEFGTVEVPVGFRTDLASIPLLNPNDDSRRAATVHDFLYALQGSTGFPKYRADEFLRAAMLSDGCSGFQAETFYYAVHWFGGPSWRGDAGRLDTSDFDTHVHYLAWASTVRFAQR